MSSYRHNDKYTSTPNIIRKYNIAENGGLSSFIAQHKHIPRHRPFWQSVFPEVVRSPDSPSDGISTLSFLPFPCGHEDSLLSDRNATEQSFLIQGVSKVVRALKIVPNNEHAGHNSVPPMLGSRPHCWGRIRSAGVHIFCANSERWLQLSRSSQGERGASSIPRKVRGERVRLCS